MSTEEDICSDAAADADAGSAGELREYERVRDTDLSLCPPPDDDDDDPDVLDVDDEVLG